MSQIFRKSTNLFTRVILFGVVLILGIAGWAVDRISRSDYTTRAAAHYRNPLWTNRVGIVDWQELKGEVANDITIASEAKREGP